MEKTDKKEKEEKEFATIKMTKTADGLRLDISGDLLMNCCCCEPGSEEEQSDSSCCPDDTGKMDK